MSRRNETEILLIRAEYRARAECAVLQHIDHHFEQFGTFPTVDDICAVRLELLELESVWVNQEWNARRMVKK